MFLMIQCLGINMSIDDIDNPFEKQNLKKKLELQERKRNIVGLVTVYPKKPIDPIEELLNNNDKK